MKQHFGQIFVGVCIVIAALIFTHSPKNQAHHYEWHVEGSTLVVFDTDTGDVFAWQHTNRTWVTLPLIPVRQGDEFGSVRVK